MGKKTRGLNIRDSTVIDGAALSNLPAGLILVVVLTAQQHIFVHRERNYSNLKSSGNKIRQPKSCNEKIQSKSDIWVTKSNIISSKVAKACEVIEL